jgi:hypothetical protein
MKTRLPALSIAILLILIPACSGDDDPVDPGGGGEADTTPPAAVTNLAVSASTDTTITVAWNAPGDDGATGTAAQYSIRHSSTNITEGNWAGATPVAAPVPAQAGTAQSVIIHNPPKSDLHVGLKTADEAGNWSALSNIVSHSFSDPGGDTIPPAAVTNLTVFASTDTTITVAWHAPGDDGTIGTAARYDIRHSATAITEGNWASATAVEGPVPALAGTAQNVKIRNPAKSDLYVGLKTADEADNWSALSNIVMHTFPDPPAEVHHLTDEFENREPCLHDGIVTWIRREGADYDVYRADLTSPDPSIVRITDDGGEKGNLSATSTMAVWQHRPDSSEDWEIWVYRHGMSPALSQFTDNEDEDEHPVVAGGGDIAWSRGDIMFEDIMYWDAGSAEVSTISLNCCPTSEYSNDAPAAHNGMVVWRSWHRAELGPHKAFLWEEGVTTEISAEVEAPIARGFSIHDGELAYEYSGEPTQIAYWDGSSAQVVGPGQTPSLYQGRIGYVFWDGGDYEIRYWDGTEIHQITDNNDIHDSQVSVWGDLMVWCSRFEDGGLWQIHYRQVP